jgi:hypothetical protein
MPPVAVGAVQVVELRGVGPELGEQDVAAVVAQSFGQHDSQPQQDPGEPTHTGTTRRLDGCG